uniref:Cationic amino acid transporter-like protein n=1 Tax=Philodina roseola TaxID=96448 RepID=B6S378_PHIRO|nr:cationic amino acid transporter-like protein [Philodina roseola]
MVPNIKKICNPDHLNDGRVSFVLKTFFKRLIERKDYDVLQQELLTQNNLRLNALNVFHLIGIGLGGTIGTGIYNLGGKAAGLYAGPSVIISFILSGVVALLSSLSFSEMSSIMASPGSAYTYTYVEYAAFFIGWSYMILYQLAASTVVVAWSSEVVRFIDLISDYNASRYIVQAPVAWSEKTESFYSTGQVLNIPAIAITLAITVILILGIRETANTNLALVTFKIIVLLIFIFAGCVYVKTENYRPFFPSNEGSFKKFGFTGMLQGTLFVFFAYIGFESVSPLAKEAKLSSSNVRTATIVTTVVTMALYIGISTVMVGLVPYQELNTDSPLTVAIDQTPYGMWLKILLNIGAIVSLATVANTVLLAQIRIFYAMGKDNLLPAILSRVQKDRKTPLFQFISGGICALISGVCPVDLIGEAASVAALVIYLAVHICVIIMRYTHRGVKRSFSVPLGPWVIPVVGGLLCILLLVNTTKGTAIRYAIWMGIGQIVYFGYSYRHSTVGRQMRSGSMASIAELVQRPTIEPVDVVSQPEPPGTPHLATIEEAIKEAAVDSF